VAKVLPFVEVADHRPGRALERADLRRHLEQPRQASLFA